MSTIWDTIDQFSAPLKAIGYHISFKVTPLWLPFRPQQLLGAGVERSIGGCYCKGLVNVSFYLTKLKQSPPLTTPPKHQHSKTMTNTTKTFQDWLNTTHPFPDYVEVLGIRRGQWLSNKLHDCHPILVQQARKCGVDCYYDDSKIDRMIAFAAVYWDNPHSAPVS